MGFVLKLERIFNKKLSIVTVIRYNGIEDINFTDGGVIRYGDNQRVSSDYLNDKPPTIKNSKCVEKRINENLSIIIQTHKIEYDNINFDKCINSIEEYASFIKEIEEKIYVKV